VSHLSDDELVLHYYGEDGPRIVAAERHLRSCAHCARTYEALARTLSAVTPPEVVEAADDIQAVRQMLRERARRQPAPRGLVAVVWLVPLLYPFSFQALFNSGQLAHEHLFGMPLVALTLAWACAGPFVAVYALNRMSVDSFERASTRLLVFGALVASISPVLYVLIARVSPGLPTWYGAVLLASLLALLRWPNSLRSPARLRYVHRLSALLITVFALTHVGNQVFGFVSLSSYAATMNILRAAYQQPIVESILMASVAIQIATGAAMGMKKVRAGALTENLQVVSGWYLALFLLTHVFAGLLLYGRQVPAPAATIAATQFNLLASARGTAQLPFLLLGAAAFLFHVGAYARLTALAFLAEAWVRRLSYAAAFVGTTVVVTVGLALCGIHLIR
jgi:succinate dehydrogenase/fumarate reductase cytochrome b subunit